LGGIVAQVTIIGVTDPSLLISESATDLFASVMLGSIVFMTPIWGMVSACVVAVSNHAGEVT
jgi:hypothetical protein